jgi:hypothetical protein
VNKPLVTIAIQASGLSGQLGRPIAVITRALEATTDALVLLKWNGDTYVEARRFMWPVGHLTGARADAIASAMGNELYNLIMTWIGIQTDLGLVTDA